MSELRDYRYRYVVEVRFSPAIGQHHFKLRAVPRQNAFQRIVSHRLEISPACHWLTAADGFGNAVQYGCFMHLHEEMAVVSEGVVRCGLYGIGQCDPPHIYLQPTSLTWWDADMSRWATEVACGVARDWSIGHKNDPRQAFTVADELMHAVFLRVEYQRFATDGETSANDVFHLRRGVCQDFAHLMIAACRSVGLAARYANGLVEGEGETHAWVEVCVDGQWHGFDPSRDCRVEWGYLKIGHGRDVNDCPSNRGHIYGHTIERMTVCAQLLTI